MAEGGRFNELSKTLSSGSESVFDFYCELCKDDDKNVEAEGFCVDCEEYLCGSCFSVHRKTRLSRHHELLDKDKMPRDTPLSADRIRTDIATKCKAHSGKTVEFYCETHKALVCNLCFVDEHKSCSDVESILKKSEGIFESKAYSDFMQILTSLDQQTQDIIKKTQANVARTKSCYAEIVKTVKHLREEVTVTLDKLEQDIIREAKALLSEEEKKMAAISNKCSTAEKEIATIRADIESLHSSRRACQAYISMKENDKRIETLQNDVHAAEEGLVLRTYKFESNKKLQELVGSQNALGKISCEVQITERKQMKADKPMCMEATHVSDIDVRTNTDDETCNITGSAVVSSNRLIIADNNNNKVELLDIQTNQVISEMKVYGGPWDVTVITRNQAAVTVPSIKKILLLSMADTLTLDRKITVDGLCYGVEYSKDRLIVTYTYPARLEIMDLSGNVMKRIQHDRDGKQLFQQPQYVCVSNDGETLYVSDYSSDTVTSFTFDGVLKAKYSDSELRGPRKVCLDHNGNVFVCGRDSRNVHMLTADLNKIQIILTQADRLDSNVYSVSHCQETNRLYVGMLNSSKMKVYQLT